MQSIKSCVRGFLASGPLAENKKKIVEIYLTDIETINVSILYPCVFVSAPFD